MKRLSSVCVMLFLSALLLYLLPGSVQAEEAAVLKVEAAAAPTLR